MAQGRMIKTKIGASKRVHDLSSDTCRLAYTWTIAHLDRDGRIEGDPAILKSKVFPRRDDITTEQMRGFIQEWHDHGLIIWYKAKGDLFIFFPGFKGEQIGMRYDKEADSYIPSVENGEIMPKTKDVLKAEQGRSDDGVRPEEWNGMEKNGMEKNSAEETSAEVVTTSSDSLLPSAVSTKTFKDPLLHDTLDFCEKAYGATLPRYDIQTISAKKIIKDMQKDREKVGHFLKTAYRMHQSRAAPIGGKPFLPTTLTTQFVFDAICNEMKKRKQDTVADFIFGGAK